MSVLCSSLKPCFVRIPALRSSSLVFLLLHVLACHLLPPLCQSLASGAVFPCSEAASMVARVAFWRVKDNKTRLQHTLISHKNLRTKELVKQISLPQCSQTLTCSTSLSVDGTTNHKQARGRQGEEQSIKDEETERREAGG